MQAGMSDSEASLLKRVETEGLNMVDPSDALYPGVTAFKGSATFEPCRSMVSAAEALSFCPATTIARSAARPRTSPAPAGKSGVIEP